jgi:hypothetical protein
MRFKRKSRAALILVAVISCLTLIISSAAGAGQPGSDTDPLVTKSYVDQQIASVLSKIASSGSGTGTGSTIDAAVIAQLQTDVGDLTKFIIDALTEIETLKAKINSLETGFVVVELKAGQKLLLSGGSEAILRNGSATALKGANGDLLIDASGGKDLAQGAAIPLQHILIASRTDGRGLLAKTNCFVLVRGAYTIQ